MPRTFKKKTDREFPEGDMKNAVRDILDKKGPLRAVAAHRNVTKSRLAEYVKKAREVGFENTDFTPNFRGRQVFSDSMEAAFEKYLIDCARMFYGLTPLKTRQLAYEFAVANNLRFPDKWNEKKEAGPDWFSSFMKRHSKLSIQKPEATSRARMTSFNRSTVGGFFDKLENVLKRFTFQSQDIFNLDETGVTTVASVEKIVGIRGEKQLGQVTSRERGELVTLVGIICANGNALPPCFVFPRVRFDAARMMSGAPQGSLGLVHKSGYMTEENFLPVLVFFQKNVRCSKEHPVLLVLDNHDSHLTLDGVNFCRNNGITILTLPPHTSNHLQPLDRSVFGPFKKFFSVEVHSWMMNHPNETMNIYSIPELCAKAWDRGATPENVKSGFLKTGISPFDRNIFSDHDFLCSQVSDRPAPDPTHGSPGGPGPSGPNTIIGCPDVSDPPLDNPFHPISSTSRVPDSPVSLTSCGPVNSGPSTSSCPVGLLYEPQTPRKEVDLKKKFVSPEEVRPHLKAGPRKTVRGGRKRGRCFVPTDTPEKEELEERMKKKEDLEREKAARREILQKKKAARAAEVEEDSDDDIVPEKITQDSSSSDWEELDSDDIKDVADATEGDFLIVKVPSQNKKFKMNFVAKVAKKVSGGFEVNFFQRLSPSNRFKETGEPASFVAAEQAIAVLPPGIVDKRQRFQGMLYFNCDITPFCLQ